MLSSYIEHPVNCHFEGQDPGEKILLLLRAHPVTNLQWIFPAVLLFFVPFFAPKLLTFINLDLSWLPESFGLIFLIINYLLVLVVVFEGFLHWYFNVYIVTNQNVIDIDFHSLLFKNIDIAPIRNIEDTASSMSGILNTFFNYGNVFIQTSGTSRNIEFLDIPKPNQVADFILDEIHKIHGS